jgi:hypothetical protein
LDILNVTSGVAVGVDISKLQDMDKILRTTHTNKTKDMEGKRE